MLDKRLPPLRLVLLGALLPAVLIACGGGSSDPSATDTAATATGIDPSARAATMDTALAVVRAAATAPSYVTLANEGASFTVDGTQTVRFGAGSRWIEKSVTGSGQCTNVFFGSDPAYGTYKSCQVVVPSVAMTTIAAENGGFTVTGTQVVQYGAGALWTQKSITGTGQCTNAFFGKDPAYGVVKSCRVAATPTQVAPVAPAPSGATVTAWVRTANENDPVAITTAQTVRFGTGAKWVTQTLNPGAICSIATFGADPGPWLTKFCEVQVTAPAVTQVAGARPVVNTGLLPAAAKGATTPQVRPLTAGELANPGMLPAPTDVSAFREPCLFSHMGADDPIAFAGKPGASHMHTFMGNSLTSSASTADSLAGSGGSSCVGGTLNRTAYWQPTMIDSRTGQPVTPISGQFYYKQGYLGVSGASIQAFPHGLRMIAGDANATTPVNATSRFACLNGGSWQTSIPTCAVGDTLMVSVAFPQCWDGVNVDSPDHRSHMAYATGAGCPSDHPVALPEVTIRFDYVIGETGASSNWRLSSDNYSGPAGYSLHADWFGGWDPATNQTFVTRCLNAGMDCHDYLLGDGRIMY